MTPWLTIQYGASSTTAVLTWPGGAWRPLPFDGGLVLSSAVHVGAAGVAGGAEAWRRASADPDGFLPAPLRSGMGDVTVGGCCVPTADLAACTLTLVADEASQLAGDSIEHLRMVIPAGWGPRRKTWLRHAVRSASLPPPSFVEAPLATVRLLSRHDGLPVAVIDLGAGCEAALLHQNGAGWEVLSALTDPAAGGDGIDAALITLLTGTDLTEIAGGARWRTIAATRTAKQALSEQLAVTVALPTRAEPVVVTATQLQQAAQPILVRAAKLAAAAAEAADLSVHQLGAVHLIGATAAIPGAAETISAELGVTVQTAQDPARVSLLAAGGANPAPSAESTGPAPGRRPSLYRLAALGVPGLLSLVLYTHFAFSATFNNGTPDTPRPGYYVLAAWGELTTACALAVVAVLQTVPVLVMHLDSRLASEGQESPAGLRTAGCLAAAAAAGIALTSLYAITAAIYMAYPVARLLTWAVLPILPLILCVFAFAVFAAQRRLATDGPQPPLIFPISSVLTAAAGTAAVTAWWHTGLPAWANGWWGETIGYLGGFLLGVGIACAVTRHPVARIIATLTLSPFLLLISRSGPDIPALLFAVALAISCARRVIEVASTRSPFPLSGLSAGREPKRAR
jgi:hypothetical protein